MPGDICFALGAVAIFLFTIQAVIAIFRDQTPTKPLLNE
jgi:hypothetical protein